eukprot:TRINITY_DN3262_c0_g1_i18.p1 TRINITY_DN3262_c0_g1~~TRINITY_DN3262_c0_g1_i18.p1  ORF type:complete len:118 (-),score=28.41 TRINITY_DN3262_c0_g1_i18:352-669(-)
MKFFQGGFFSVDNFSCYIQRSGYTGEGSSGINAEYGERYACENVQKLLIANKCDEDGSRKISAEKLKAFANDHHLNVLETSAKNSINIEEIFTNLSEMMLKEANE